MSFLDELKDIKKELQKEQRYSKKEKNKSSKSGVNIKSTDLGTLEKDLSEQNAVKRQEQEFEDIFLKQERLANEFMEFIKNSDIKKIQ
ncbi:hypothetical protein [Campylobacter armoricus]|uniref:hypothetical protein n=1 Tax=Campylobacter armoricus TaxID=2505970 RepID=UPI00111752CD|nr:hypothetical protein [Campylobacter armoricus]